LFGLFLTPVFYVALRRLVERRGSRPAKSDRPLAVAVLPGSVPVEVSHV
jgi:hypothetical protein